MSDLNSASWMFLFLFLFFSVALAAIGRTSLTSARAFFRAERPLPPLLAAVALALSGASLLDLLAAGLIGASFGLAALDFFSLGAIAALLFSALVLTPALHRAKASSIPALLGRRFTPVLRRTSAALLALFTLASAALALALFAQLVQRLHFADTLFYALGWPRQAIFFAAVLVPTAAALLYILRAGLRGAALNHILQFLLLLAAFLPALVYGFTHTASPLSSLNAALDPARPGPLPLIAAGLLFGLLASSLDPRATQILLATRNASSARTIALAALPLRLLLLVALALIGSLALIQPTPESSTRVHEVNGIIYHETQVVPLSASGGHGLVPAHLDASELHLLRTPSGAVQLDPALAAPTLLFKALPPALAGLGLAALLAALLASLGPSLLSFAALLLEDMALPFRGFSAHQADGSPSLGAARRLAALAALLIVTCASLFALADLLSLDRLFALFLELASLLSASLFATLLAALFFKRIEARGALFGLAAGELAALLHHALALPLNAAPGLAGGWIAPLFRYDSPLTQNLVTAALALALNLLIAPLASRRALTR